MFKTLRSKLIATYAGIAVLSIGLALIVTVALASDLARESGMRSLREKRALAIPLIRIELGADRSPKLLTKLRSNVRAGFFDSRLRMMRVDARNYQIIEDTAAQYVQTGERFPFETLGASSPAALQRSLEGYHRFPNDPVSYQFSAQLVTGLPLGGSFLSDGPTTQASRGNISPQIIVLLQPEPQVAAVGGEYASSVLPAVLAALIVSLLVALALARSIARPLARLTDATVAMSSGDYDQEVVATGHDEIAELAGRFNLMAAEVAKTRRMQRDFVANVSHDLKTPLTSIQGFSQAILDGTVSDDTGYKQAAAVINDEARHMAGLVSALLNLSKLQSGLMKMEMRPLDLGPVMANLVLAMTPQAAAAGVRLSLNSPPMLPTILADPDRLRQAFGNLLDNALKNTPPDGTVTVGLETTSSELKLIIRDMGRGIPAVDLPRIGERFYQVDKSRQSGTGRSVGLGLAIAREIVAAHHAMLNISSLVGEGTTVTIVFPAQHIPGAAIAKRRSLSLRERPRTTEVS